MAEHAPPLAWNTVAIVGVGLIGGSFALALREAGFRGRLLGVSSAATITQARDLGIIDSGATCEEAVRQADLVYLAQPVGAILRTVQQCARWLGPQSLVTDAGSTKLAIVNAGREFLPPGRFLGGHPMAGKETRGAAAADADLFRGRTYVLTPDDEAHWEQEAVVTLRWWLDQIGARVVSARPAEHDRVVACTSHVPQLASTALALLTAEYLKPEQYAISGPGLRDMTRLALSSYDLWSDILDTNAAEVEVALGAYIQVLQQVRATLAEAGLRETFEQAAAAARQLRNPAL